MSRLKTTLTERLAKVKARIVEIEAVYPKIAKIKSYGRNYNATQTGYQDFGAVAKEYRDLLDDEERLSARLDDLEGNGDGSFLAEFRSQY